MTGFAFSASEKIKKKLLEKHSVTLSEVEQCFYNRTEDDREDHKTNPPTQWFISTTNKGRKLKVCFVLEDHQIHIKTAFEPDPEAIRIYNKHSKE